MKQRFSEMKLGSAKLAVIERANGIIEDYQSQAIREVIDKEALSRVEEREEAGREALGRALEDAKLP